MIEVYVLDQKKIGEFLRELRKEKGMTQEQVAEHFNIAGRTVSRWETGSNMPDIGIISEIASFYEVDIREIINGERDAATENREDVVAKVIEYADTENEILAQNVTKYSIIGLIAMLVFVLIAKYGVLEKGIIASLAESVAMLFVLLGLGKSIMFSLGRLGKHLEERKKRAKIIWFVRILLLLGALMMFAAACSGLLVASA